jgi:hypothetical protein
MNTQVNKKLILLELNEINFDAVSFYIQNNINLPGFKKIIESGINNTIAEEDYDNLEPWIQWPSVHIGKKFDEHKIFRLGDVVNSTEKQIFEKVEERGYSVGAISPMNASNKLINPKYFIPDPWTVTPSDKSYLSKSISQAVSQAVNDNSKSKLTYKTILNLCISFALLVNPTKFFSMIVYAISALRKPWRKALFLDMLLFEFHKTLFRRKKPNFSTLFLNAGAHIQHHYFFNSPFASNDKLQNPSWYIESNEDPFLEMLLIYDSMIQDVLSLKNTEVIVATGLSQKPYEKLKFYYRLRDHENFLRNVGLEYKNVTPRMTRDFLISFDTVEEALEAENFLSEVLVNNKTKLFAQIDNRGNDIFTVLTYPYEITQNTEINLANKKLLLQDHVVFVAIKNGEHQSKGFAYFTDKISRFAPENNSHVSKIHDVILKYFGIA